MAELIHHKYQGHSFKLTVRTCCDSHCVCQREVSKRPLNCHLWTEKGAWRLTETSNQFFQGHQFAFFLYQIGIFILYKNTKVYYQPQTSQEYAYRGNIIKTRLLCYSGMSSHINKSLEELRIEDYVINGKIIVNKHFHIIMALEQ